MRALVEKAIEWELAARDVYASLDRALQEPQPEAAAFFQQLAIDESSHARMLRNALESSDDELLASSVDSKVLQLVADVDYEVRMAASKPMVTLDDAYEVAHRFENSEINTIFQLYAMPEVDANSREMMLKDQIYTHLAHLDAFAKRFPRASRTDIELNL